MNQKKLIIVLIGVILVIGYLIYRVENTSKGSVTTGTNCRPTFVDGGGPYYKNDAPFRDKIVPNKNNGEKLIVKGKVLRNDCKTSVRGAIVDIWQANENGNYQDEWYRGRVTADQNGNYRFETIIPKGYGEGSGFRPPHIHFKIWEGESEIITSQMFFPESKGKPGFNDEYIMSVKTNNGIFGKYHEGYHDIILP